MSAIQIPPSVRLGHPDVSNEEIPSTADTIHNIPRLRRDRLVLLGLDTLFSLFRSATLRYPCLIPIPLRLLQESKISLYSHNPFASGIVAI